MGSQEQAPGLDWRRHKRSQVCGDHEACLSWSQVGFENELYYNYNQLRPVEEVKESSGADPMDVGAFGAHGGRDGHCIAVDKQTAQCISQKTQVLQHLVMIQRGV